MSIANKKSIARMRECLQYARTFEAESDAPLSQDMGRAGKVTHFFALACMLSIDIARGIIKDNGFRPPKTYADSFAVLEEEKILSAQAAASMKKAAAFRNEAAHQTMAIDYDIIQNAVLHNAKDVEAFADEVEKYLEGL